ncbi:TetR/AcrR family transcriptional regulator [Cognatiyoonia sp. IB215182]|uniref:TetR/AcrR family transcriptional regulator n=1 Tax=Cognatiyoonia sp. IB215182 TaxID=3097353 RepID=UPI002A17D0D7|nr:TetR/AcrR family transcriptional regulator [Cognatiyoonia sp. IB215182]MDX8351277.1 TetR/AcrR family transcriptional regulator [Cognatiyoonia sp. IB215182]
MARPKSYDRDDAIAKACMAFWQHGYQALGVRELERLTGLNQFAIRSEFGGKEGLYLEALRYYADAAMTEEFSPMKTGGIAEVMAFFRGLVTDGSLTSSDFGCLIVNTGIENARVQSERLDEAARAYWAALEAHFRMALERDAGQPARFDPGTLAKALVSAVMGIHAQNRAQQSNQAGRYLVDMVCANLAALEQT